MRLMNNRKKKKRKVQRAILRSLHGKRVHINGVKLRIFHLLIRVRQENFFFFYPPFTNMYQEILRAGLGTAHLPIKTVLWRSTVLRAVASFAVTSDRY